MDIKMYLGLLNVEEKNIFLDLGIMLASSDFIFEEAEKDALALLCDEMKIDVRYDAEKSMDECIEYICANSSKKNRKIILFELVGIAYADQNFVKEENEMIQKFASGIGIDKQDIVYVMDKVAKLYKEYGDIVSFLNR